jgi:hypothetical protein
VTVVSYPAPKSVLVNVRSRDGDYGKYPPKLRSELVVSEPPTLYFGAIGYD